MLFNCKWVWWDSNQLDRNEVDVSNIAGNSTAFNNEKKQQTYQHTEDPEM